MAFMNTDDILKPLNEPQQQAATILNGPVLVLAGAGSGKTRTLVHRLAYLIASGTAPASSVLAVTFTNKAAQEMRLRAAKLVTGPGQAMPLVGTFHSISARWLRHEALRLGLKRQFSIYDDSDQKRIIKAIIKELGWPLKKFSVGAFMNIISRAKSELISPDNFLRWAGEDTFTKKAATVYDRYEQMLQAGQALDFDDLIGKMVKLWQSDAGLLKQYQRRFSYLLVDEYQDTNHAQYAWVNLLASGSRNLCVVGDDWQSIYSWRGADFGNILRFTKDYPDAQVVKLEQNYRSTKNIIAAGNAVMQPALAKTDKTLWTANAEGVKLIVTETIDEISEAQFVVDEILQSLSAHTSSEPLYWSADDKPMTQNWTVEQLQYLQRFAVLYRTNAQSRVLEEAFLRAGIPYQLIGGIRFYERQEVKDVLAYLRLIINPFDVISFERALTTPRRGIGEDTVSKIMLLARDTKISLLERCQNPENLGLPTSKQGILKAWAKLIQEFTHAAATLSVADLIDLVIDKSGIKEELNDGSPEGVVRLENIEELKSVALERGGNPGLDELIKFLEEVALYQDHDRYNSQGGGVTLMTLHSAKGLEFDVVFIVGIEEGLFPHMNSLDDKKELDEERRLAYVGITRAREKVYLIYTSLRTLVGTSFLGLPSRFITDIPDELLEWKKLE